MPNLRALCRKAAVIASATAVTGGLCAFGTSSLASASSRTQAAATTNGTYLALGDSVTFGYRESNTKPAPNYAKQATFVGYPEYVGQALGLSVANAACPGETTASFLNMYAQSNGCENSLVKGKKVDQGYRTAYPLHVSYQHSQMTYANQFLKANPDTRVVSLMIGANDGFLCEARTKDHCLKQFASVAKRIGTNVAKILYQIRETDGYTGLIVIVNYYSMNYRNTLDNLESQVLNEAMDKAGSNFGVTIADGYGAFKTASAHSGGNPCKAGLLTQLTTGTCGVHPSFAGQQVLAQTVETAITQNS